MGEEHPFFALARHQRACRSFTADPVADDVLAAILDAATRAPSAENRQPWHFVVVRDADQRQQLVDVMARLWQGGARDYARRNLDDALFVDVDQGFVAGIAGAPVLVVVCGDADRSRRAQLPSSVFPAVQNLLLAAQASGLGTVLTTLAAIDPAPVAQVLDLPESIVPMAVVPVGHPARPLGPNRREPLAGKVSRDRWGQAWP